MTGHFQYKAKIQEIPSIRRDLEILGKVWEIPGAIVRQLTMAIEELFSKIINNPCPANDQYFVRLEFFLEDKKVSMKIIDNSCPYNPMNNEVMDSGNITFTDFDEMGIMLIKAFIDSHHYVRKDEKNITTLLKIIKKPV